MTNETELAEAFAPCTLSGLADEWDRLNAEISAIRKSRDAIAAILLEASCKDHNGADWPFRTGAIIEGKEVAIQAVWRLTEGGERPKWEPRLQYVREQGSMTRSKDQ